MTPHAAITITNRRSVEDLTAIIADGSLVSIARVYRSLITLIRIII